MSIVSMILVVIILSVSLPVALAVIGHHISLRVCPVSMRKFADEVVWLYRRGVVTHIVSGEYGSESFSRRFPQIKFREDLTEKDKKSLSKKLDKFEKNYFFFAIFEDTDFRMNLVNRHHLMIHRWNTYIVLTTSGQGVPIEHSKLNAKKRKS